MEDCTCPSPTLTLLAVLKPARRARALALLEHLEAYGGAADFRALDRALVPHHRLDDGAFSRGELNQAIDDLADAGVLEITPEAEGDLLIRLLAAPQ